MIDGWCGRSRWWRWRAGCDELLGCLAVRCRCPYASISGDARDVRMKQTPAFFRMRQLMLTADTAHTHTHTLSLSRLTSHVSQSHTHTSHSHSHITDTQLTAHSSTDRTELRRTAPLHVAFICKTQTRSDVLRKYDPCRFLSLRLIKTSKIRRERHAGSSLTAAFPP